MNATEPSSGADAARSGELTASAPPVARRCRPRTAAFVVAAILALSFSYDLMRMPVQVSDSFIEMLDAQQSPSLTAMFVSIAQRQAYFRPLRLVQIKALFDVADGHYWLVYRGFHALLLCIALWLFTRALRVRSWPEFAAAMFALTVFTGIHTFRGLVQEAFPINHFLEIVVFCLVALNLAQSRGGWWVDVAAVLTFVAASLTLESGLLVWVVIAGSWISGLRGISKRGVVATTVVLGAYFWVRFQFLSVGTPGLDERSSGFGTTLLEPEDLVRRFGADPTWFYLYNIASSMLTVLFSEPDRGIFHVGRAWLQEEIPARLYLKIVPSVITTGLLIWVAVHRLKNRTKGTFRLTDQFFVLFGIVLVTNSVMSYPYTKHEIMSVAGTFYALATFAVASCVIERLQGQLGAGALSRAGRFVVGSLLVAVATMWAFRAVGMHYMLQVQAFNERNEWARLDTERLGDRDYRSDASARALAVQLRRDALEMRISNPRLMPRWAQTWWAE
ncbi:MAG: hypothetical protein HOP16_12765 [Acidobacteria bacterium]|nr:hypothetical protein [Acidobacteriota bacterium]